MIYAIMGVVIIVCVIKAQLYKAGSAALVKYMKDKGYTPPTDAEMKACSTYALKKQFRIKK